MIYAVVPLKPGTTLETQIRFVEILVPIQKKESPTHLLCVV